MGGPFLFYDLDFDAPAAGAPIIRPIVAKRNGFAIADRRKPIRVAARFAQRMRDGDGAALAERLVVGLGADIVGMPTDFELLRRTGRGNDGEVLDDGDGRRRHRRFVWLEMKRSVAQHLRETGRTIGSRLRA